MRILLQSKDNDLYYRDAAEWVRESTEALNFLSSTSAIDFCVAQKLKNVQLVLKFDEQQYDIVLPVVTRHHHPRHASTPASGRAGLSAHP